MAKSKSATPVTIAGAPKNLISITPKDVIPGLDIVFGFCIQGGRVIPIANEGAPVQIVFNLVFYKEGAGGRAEALLNRFSYRWVEGTDIAKEPTDAQVIAKVADLWKLELM